MADWSDIRAAWDASWSRVEAAALQKWQAAIEATPERFREPVEAFLNTLAGTRLRLDEALQLAKMPGATGTDRGQYMRLQSQYNAVAAGMMVHATPTDAEETGAVPVLVVAGLAISVAGVAWAIAAYEYAASLRDQVQLYREDLTARVAAAQQGLTLQPSTVPAPTSPPSTPGSMWPWLLGLGVLGAGGLTLYTLRK